MRGAFTIFRSAINSLFALIALLLLTLPIRATGSMTARHMDDKRTVDLRHLSFVIYNTCSLLLVLLSSIVASGPSTLEISYVKSGSEAGDHFVVMQVAVT